MGRKVYEEQNKYKLLSLVALNMFVQYAQTTPAGWKDYFFAEAHGLPGN